MKTSWTVHTEEDENGDIVLPFSADMMSQLEWKEGDTLDFRETDGEITIINLSWLARTHPNDN